MKIIAVLVSILLVARFTSAQEPASPASDAIFKVNVKMVMVDTQVVSKKTHRAMNFLQQDDFRLYEDGIPQEISSFSQDALPLSVVLLFDLTASVHPVLKSLANGALQALHRLKPEDEVAVIVYSASATTVQDFTTDREVAAAAIAKASRMESDEAAFFNEGIFQAVSQLEKSGNPIGRKVIVWMTDNIPNLPTDEISGRYGRSLHGKRPHGEREALAALFRTGTVVCTLLQVDDSWINSSRGAISDRMLYPPGDVYRYAEQTGGWVMESTRKAVNSKLADLIDEIRVRYSLGYHPSVERPAGRFCRINVKLSPAVIKQEGKVFVEARRGYYR
ncbi:MAG TPA: VWA domain-containing protein [Candidatus Angelobacter sp.]|nr:VWA domain-containing protein [Candidatus Angelobacter sp.]